MTGSTPSDLAVTFRSVDRRLREALDSTPATDPAVAGLVAQLRAAVASAASTMGVAGGDGDLSTGPSPEGGGTGHARRWRRHGGWRRRRRGAVAAPSSRVLVGAADDRGHASPVSVARP